MKNDRRIVFTNHATQRMREFQVAYKEALDMLKDSEEEHPPDPKYKREKYIDNWVYYRRWGPYIFTLKDMLDKYTEEPISLVITVANQAINLKRVPAVENKVVKEKFDKLEHTANWLLSPEEVKEKNYRLFKKNQEKYHKNWKGKI